MSVTFGVRIRSYAEDGLVPCAAALGRLAAVGPAAAAIGWLSALRAAVHREVRCRVRPSVMGISKPTAARIAA